MRKGGRGRPKGTGGPVAVLSSENEKLLAQFLRSDRCRDERAKLAILLSLTLGVRATELALLRFAHVFDLEGRVRTALLLKRGGLANPMLLPLKSKELRIALADCGPRRSRCRIFLDPHAPHHDHRRQ